MSISVADLGFDIGGRRVNFVNGGRWVGGVFGGSLKVLTLEVQVFFMFLTFFLLKRCLKMNRDQQNHLKLRKLSVMGNKIIGLGLLGWARCAPLLWIRYCILGLG